MNKNIIAVNMGKGVALGLKLFSFGSGTSMPGIVAKKIAEIYKNENYPKYLVIPEHC